MLQTILGTLTVTAVVAVGCGIVFLVFHRTGLPLRIRARLLPSTVLTTGALLAGIELIALLIATQANRVGDWGAADAIWGVTSAILGGGIGIVSSLFAIAMVPRWQWIGQVVASGISLTVGGAGYLFVAGFI